MARIQLRDTTIYFQDGFVGTAAVNDAAGIQVGDVDVTIDTQVTNASVTTVVPVGARFTVPSDTQIYTVTAHTPNDEVGPTTNIAYTPASLVALADDGAITFLPQRLEIKIGEGDVSWSESREFIYDTDRDLLDTVRQGADQPMSVDMAFTFEYVTASSGLAATPSDALNNDGAAATWVSSSSDLCEPYAVDVVVLHCVPCGTDEDQEITLTDFRYESLDFSVADAAVSVSGQCNATRATTVRSTNTNC